MKRVAALISVALLTLVFVSCRPTPIDEELLATPVPTLPPSGLDEESSETEHVDSAGEEAPDSAADTDEDHETGADREGSTAGDDEVTSEATEVDQEAESVESDEVADADAHGEASGSSESAGEGEADEAATDHDEAGPADAEPFDEDDSHEAAPEASGEDHKNDAESEEAEKNLEDETHDDATSDDATDPHAGLPASLVIALESADPVRGQALAVQNACTACHALDPAQVMPGPTWSDLAGTAASRVPGEGAAAYLYNSIVAPNSYLTEGYAPGVMLQTYGETLPEQDLADILAYLLTLHEEE